MSKSTSSSSSGIGFVGLLTIVFIVLKLLEITAVAKWTWWWVLSPLWISTALWIVIVVPLMIWAWRIEKKRDRERAELLTKSVFPTKKSKFMEKLDEAMEASKHKREQN